MVWYLTGYCPEMDAPNRPTRPKDTVRARMLKEASTLTNSSAVGLARHALELLLQIVPNIYDSVQ